jgi:hypothetical protein
MIDISDDAIRNDLCNTCLKVFDCMGQGVFGTEECSEWVANDSTSTQDAANRGEQKPAEASIQPAKPLSM